jgi:cytochrome c nitrite reductase small subunit
MVTRAARRGIDGRALAVAAVIGLGLALGLGAYTFVYARGAAYLTNDPAACANCHVMREQLDGWIASSHRAVAVCNDCHAPHDLVGKYMTKAINGFWHSLAFTTNDFHEPIAIGARNRAVTEGACRHCHVEIVEAIETVGRGHGGVDCIRCHRSVGHLH